MNIVHKTIEVGTDKFDRFDFCVTKERPDRYGDIIVVKGIKYPPKLIGLWNHSHDVVVGTWRDFRIEADELRGRIEFAPPNISPKIDELRKLTEHGVINSCSIGFVPREQEPIFTNGRQTGIRFLRSELCEISLVSCPANVDAVSLAKSLNVSDAMLREVFTNMKPLTVGERIRRARATVRKARSILSKTTNEKSRQVMMRAIAILEQEDRERMAASRQLPPETSAQKAVRARARAEAVLHQVDARIARDEAASFVGQYRQEHAETIANFEAQSRAHADPPKPTLEPQTTGTWHGLKVPGQIWRGKRVW
jgi:HK97 family phage prohead protease